MIEEVDPGIGAVLKNFLVHTFFFFLNTAGYGSNFPLTGNTAGA